VVPLRPSAMSTTHLLVSFRIRKIISIAGLILPLLCSCGGGGGGGSNTGTGGGGGGGGVGGGGGTQLAITLLSPSSIMVGVPLGLVSVYGQGFSANSQVLVDGHAVNTLAGTDSSIQAQIDTSLDYTAGVHQFSVQNGSTVSNALTFTVYSPAQGPNVMQAIPGFPVGADDAPFVVAADLNGDSFADAIVPGPTLTNSESIAVLYGQLDGTLSAAHYIPVPVSPYALAVGDVDGNGTPDLVSISDVGSTVTVSILTGDGHGNFQPPVTQQSFFGDFPGPANLVDLDGDGKPDLVLAAQGNIVSTLYWMKNMGTGFAPPVTLATIAAGGFQLADFNGDGKPDLLYGVPNASGVAQSLHILMNQGNGSFSDQVAGGLNGMVGMETVVDFNLDGIPDLIIQMQQGAAAVLVSFAGLGNGSFTQVASLNIPGSAQLVTGDFDHDGFPDLAGPVGLEPSELLYYFGDGHGNFTIRPVVGPEGIWVASGDFNGDGFPDVVVPDRFNFISLSLGRKDREFPSPQALYPSFVTQAYVGDINGDGIPEIYESGFYDPVDGIVQPGTVFQNMGNSQFQFAANTDPLSFRIADLTGSGLFDLLGGSSSGTLEIWPNNKSLDFSSSPITLSQPLQGPVLVADMDGDGCPDVVATGQILYGDCAYHFTAVTLSSSEQAPLAVGHFTSSGRLDLITAGSVFINTGSRTFQEVASGLPLENGALVAVGDLNSDGKDDVAINLPGDSDIGVYYSKGDGTFYQATQLNPAQYPGAISIGDFNGDGRMDVAVGLMLSQQACIFFNNGNGQFSRSFFASGAFTVDMVQADLNRRGKSDLVIGNFVYNALPPNINVIFHQ